MGDYYSDRLSAERLRLCYEIAPPRTKAYLEGEIAFVLSRMSPGTRVLELGCGYGRVLESIVRHARSTVGIDTSRASVAMAQETLANLPAYHLLVMDALDMGFPNDIFDLVFCVQNGISAFHVDQRRLIAEAVRVARRGGTVLFSSYSDRFWEDRLEWFRIQAEHGLIGKIDDAATGDGDIVCKDGFRATTVGPRGFRELTAGLDATCDITEVADSSIFCEISVR